MKPYDIKLNDKIKNLTDFYQANFLLTFFFSGGKRAKDFEWK